MTGTLALVGIFLTDLWRGLEFYVAIGRFMSCCLAKWRDTLRNVTIALMCELQPWLAKVARRYIQSIGIAYYITFCYILRMTTTAYRELYHFAEDQMGYLTTAQASKIGVGAMTLVMMAKRGTLDRVSRGVYRLVDYPAHPLGQYMQATLWPYERPGVLSHETALALYELSDIDPVKVHITVPAHFRIQRKIPDHLVVHRADLPPSAIGHLERMPITTPAQTIRDCMAAHLGEALIKQAIEDGRRVGLLNPTTSAALRRELGALTHNSRLASR